MNRRITILAIVLAGCFGLLFLQLNNLQIHASASIRSQADAEGATSSSWSASPRGEILAADGTVLAESVKTAQGYQRAYPGGALYADVTGYYDATVKSSTGLEYDYDGDLISHQSSASNLSQVLTEGSTSADSVLTTISPSLQKIAAAALGSLQGEVVAIEPANGDIKVLYSAPSFNPSGLSTLNAASAAKYYNSLDPDSPTSPLINGVTETRIQPGSTFKVVTTATIYDHDPSVAAITWPFVSSISLPDTTNIFHNFDSESCGGTLAEALAVSCDTAYAQIGIKLGGSNLAQEARAFGFNSVPPLDLPGVIPAVFPPASSLNGNPPVTAYSAIGQENVAETPLQDVLVAAAIADGGKIMTPHLMARIVSDTGQVVEQYQPHLWRQATSATTASMVRTLMLGVATGNGTAAGVFPASLDVAAKTGTAETGTANCSADWMIAFGPASAGTTPKIAVAALLPAQSGLQCSETGAEAAGPVVEKVLAAAGG